MKTGNKVFATITVDKNGKPVVDVGDQRYKTVTLKDGAVCIVERKTQGYYEIK